MLDHEQIAERQAQLSKALQTGLLNHQILELERKLPIPQAQNGVSGTGEKGEGKSKGKANGAVVDPKQKVHRIDDTASGAGGARQFEDDERRFIDDDCQDENEDWRVVVVDASALMWAAQEVRNLVAKGFEVIVPSNGLVTLDLLKKGNSPYAQAARAAARFIEHAQRQHGLISIDPSITVQLGTNYKRGKGLRIQREDETRPADELSSLPLMPGEEGPPKWVQSVLGCAAYFMGINKAELANSIGDDDVDVKSTLYVASPPLALLIARDPGNINPETRDEIDQAEREGQYPQRGEGWVVQQEAERFEISIEILRVENDSIPGMRNQGQRSRGQGAAGNGSGQGGSNGHTNGENRPQGKPRKKEEEKEPEVKILLKRPQPPPPPEPLANSRPQGTSNAQTSGPDASGTTESTDDIVKSLLMPDFPPPVGLSGGTIDKAFASDWVHTDFSSGPIRSAPSDHVSPPMQRGTLHNVRKSPPSKFVPLTRETHPVRRQADAESTDSDDSHKERNGHGSSRGRGRGGRGGRGSSIRADGGSGRKKKDRPRDDEFRNGNFTLLQRPQPPSQAPPAKLPAPSASVPATITGLAVRPNKRNPAPSAQPRSVPAAPAAPPVRAILQRPPHGPGAANGNGKGNPTVAPARPPPPVARDMQTSWRVRGGPPRPPPAIPAAPPPVPAPSRLSPATVTAPAPGLSAKAPAFEFDEKMLSPGYGAPIPSAPTAHINGFAAFSTNGPGRGHHHGRGRGGFGHGPHGHGHHHGHHHHRPPPGPGPIPGHHQQHLHQLPDRQAAPPTPPQWQPAPQSAKPIILQRPA